jgi:Lipocalin-like domain
MNQRIILNFFAMTVLGLALVPSGAVAQQGTLKQQLVGTWTLVSSEFTASNGTKRQPYGANPKGILIFDAGGRYATVGGRSDRPKFKSASEPTTEEVAAATLDYFAANFGTWSVSEADKTLTQRFESALRPNNEGTDVKNSVSLAGDELKLSGVVPTSGVRIDSVYRRAK